MGTARLMLLKRPCDYTDPFQLGPAVAIGPQTHCPGCWDDRLTCDCVTLQELLGQVALMERDLEEIKREAKHFFKDEDKNKAAVRANRKGQ